MSEFRYPIDVCTSQTKTHTFSVESHLSVAKTSDRQSPLKIFHDKFSLYKFAIIEKDAAVKAVSANINVSDIEDIQKRSDYAFRKNMDAEIGPEQASAPAETDTSSPAYTVRIKNGKLKGKTPAEAILENPGNKELLNNQYRWLKENLAKYPGNKAQMDAISDAGRLMREGRLTAAAAAAASGAEGKCIRIYPPTKYYSPKPLIRKARADGKCQTYEIKISWTVGAEYPVEVEIQNYYARVIKKDDGTLRVVEKEDIVTKKMRLAEADWMNCLRQIRDDMRLFEMLHAKETRKDADETYAKNRNAAAGN